MSERADSNNRGGLKSESTAANFAADWELPYTGGSQITVDGRVALRLTRGVGGLGFLLLGRGAHLFESAEIAPALKGFKDQPAVKGHEAGVVFGQNRIR